MDRDCTLALLKQNTSPRMNPLPTSLWVESFRGTFFTICRAKSSSLCDNVWYQFEYLNSHSLLFVVWSKLHFISSALVSSLWISPAIWHLFWPIAVPEHGARNHSCCNVYNIHCDYFREVTFLANKGLRTFGNCPHSAEPGQGRIGRICTGTRCAQSA